MSELRAVVFDLYGTLTDPAVEARRVECDRALAAIVGADGARWTAAMRASFAARATGAWGDARSILRRLCDEVGVDPPADVFEEAVRARLVHHRELTAPRPEGARVLRALRDRGLRTAVMSDCTPEIETTWRSFPLRPLFDATVFSCEMRVKKPSEAMYAAVTTRLRVRPAECLYVGDGSSGELRGAERVGMRAVRIAADHGNHVDEERDWTGDAIATLDELLTRT